DSDASPGMKYGPRADLDPGIEDHVRVDPRVGSDTNPGSEDGVGSDPDAVPDLAPLLEDGIRGDPDPLAQADAPAQDGGRVNLGFGRQLGMEVLEEVGQGTVRIPDDKARSLVLS